MARYIVPAEMPKSCAHCQFSFWVKGRTSKKEYRCALTGLSVCLELNDFETKADWCPLVDADDLVPKRDVAGEIPAEKAIGKSVETGNLRCVPCRIGDRVYAIRSFKNGKRVYEGRVSQMYFVGEDMRLAIVVNGIARGEWGKQVFPTAKEAQNHLYDRKNDFLKEK